MPRSVAIPNAIVGEQALGATLADLLSAHKQLLLKSIPLSYWFSPHIKPKQLNIGQAPLQECLFFGNGVKLINMIFGYWHRQIQTKIFDHFNAAFLFQPIYSREGKVLESPLYHLSAKDDSIDLLDAFVTHANYTDEAMANALLDSHGPNDSKPTMSCNWRSLSHLCDSSNRLQILIKLFKTRPGVFHELMKHPDAWSSPPQVTPKRHDILLHEIAKHTSLHDPLRSKKLRCGPDPGKKLSNVLNQ